MFLALWQAWGSWEHCDKVCGAGKRSRYRNCGPNPKSSAEGCVGFGYQNDQCNRKRCMYKIKNVPVKLFKQKTKSDKKWVGSNS